MALKTKKPAPLFDMESYVPHICLNNTVVTPDSSKTVGYVHRKLESKGYVNSNFLKFCYKSINLNCCSSSYKFNRSRKLLDPGRRRIESESELWWLCSLQSLSLISLGFL